MVFKAFATNVPQYCRPMHKTETKLEYMQYNISVLQTTTQALLERIHTKRNENLGTDI